MHKDNEQQQYFTLQLNTEYISVLQISTNE